MATWKYTELMINGQPKALQIERFQMGTYHGGNLWYIFSFCR